MAPNGDAMYRLASPIHRLPAYAALVLSISSCAAPPKPLPEPASTPSSPRPASGDCEGECASEDRAGELDPMALSFLARQDKLTGTLYRTESRSTRQPAILIIHDLGILDTTGLTQGHFGVHYGSEFPLYQAAAEELAQHDVAVFSFDKRNCIRGNHPACHYPPSHLEHEVPLPDLLREDAIEALRILSTTDGIDPTQIFILGHRRGADLALELISERAFPVAGAILVAPPNEAVHQEIQRELQTAIAAVQQELEQTKDPSLADVLRQRSKELQRTLDNQDALTRAIETGAALESPISPSMDVWQAMHRQHKSARAALLERPLPLLLVEDKDDAQGGLAPADAPAPHPPGAGTTSPTDLGSDLGLLEPLASTEAVQKIVDFVHAPTAPLRSESE